MASQSGTPASLGGRDYRKATTRTRMSREQRTPTVIRGRTHEAAPQHLVPARLHSLGKRFVSIACIASFPEAESSARCRWGRRKAREDRSLVPRSQLGKWKALPVPSWNLGVGSLNVQKYSIHRNRCQPILSKKMVRSRLEHDTPAENHNHSSFLPKITLSFGSAFLSAVRGSVSFGSIRLSST